MRKALFGAGASAPSLASATRGTDPKKPLTTAVTRTYYIQAEQREWVSLPIRRVKQIHRAWHWRCTCIQLTSDGAATQGVCSAIAYRVSDARLLLQNYSPAGMNRCNGEKFAGDELLYTTKSNETLGPLYFKALYVHYTSGSFETEAGQSPWLGLLGPLIQTQVQLHPNPTLPLERAAGARSILAPAVHSAELASKIFTVGTAMTFTSISTCVMNFGDSNER